MRISETKLLHRLENGLVILDQSNFSEIVFTEKEAELLWLGLKMLFPNLGKEST